MISRGISRDVLSAACAIKPHSLSTQFAKDFPIRQIRLRVEAALGQPFWSSPADFARRQQLAARCGFDLFTASDVQLRQFTAALRLPGRSTARSKSARIALIETYLAKFPTPNINSNATNSSQKL